MKADVKLAIGLLLVFLIFIIISPSFTNSEKAISILKAQGYTNINITGYDFLACGKGDITFTGFKAIINGHLINGTVCCGAFKGCIIRFK